MTITIKEENSRFGVRVAGIIFNYDMTKVFIQKQNDHDYFMFPGGRVEIHEDAKNAILRELKEELGIKEDAKLKYIAESFVQFPNNKKYHEIGFYFIIKIREEKYNYLSGQIYDSLDEKNDGHSEFMWIEVNDLNKYNIMPSFIVEKLIGKDIKLNSDIEHIVYREYE